MLGAESVPTPTPRAARRVTLPVESPSVDRLLTAEEVAERLGVKTQWVWAQARAGRIPHVRLGRYRRFRESAVEAWLCDLEIGGASPRDRTPARAAPLRRV